jgi:molybdopterin-guanine dinucleotide biosynthesis protein A
MKKHQKHAKLIKPNIGNFGRNEFAFVGAPCGDIQSLCQQIISQLSGSKKVAYVDADHASADAEPKNLTYTEFTDKITFKQVNFQEVNEFQQRFLLQNEDVILVNGNHFQANKQIVFIHPKKEASLKKRTDQLVNVQAIIICDETPVFDWLNEAIPQLSEIPVFSYPESEKITDFIHNDINIPTLKGLVLAGGKSTRMGEDKGLINYHGKPQREYAFELLESIGVETFVSCRIEQESEISLPIISDKFVGLGPFGAILSAFQSDPNTAWLVVACDLPFVDKSALNQLISSRNSSKIGTAFYNEITHFPDPLFTIYEPKAYATMLQFLALGYSCPRKVLINADAEIIQPGSSRILRNINTPEERKEFTNTTQKAR